jgi:hypothetical protein
MEMYFHFPYAFAAWDLIEHKDNYTLLTVFAFFKALTSIHVY